MKSFCFKLLLISVFSTGAFHCLARSARDTAEPCEGFIITQDEGSRLTDSFWSIYNQRRGFLNLADTTGAFLCIKRDSIERLFSAMVSGHPNTINGFRIYLALDKDTPTHPKLKLIFAAINGNNDVDGRYFTIKMDSSIGVVTSAADIGKLKREVIAYQTDVLPYTNTKLAQCCNTKSYMYNKGLLQDIRRQIARQTENDNKKVYAIKFGLGAYHNATSEHQINQMLIGFSMIDSNGVEFFENDYSMDENFGCKMPDSVSIRKYILNLFPDLNKFSPAKQSKLIDSIFAQLKLTGDTGVPCPPNTTGCSSAKLP